MDRRALLAGAAGFAAPPALPAPAIPAKREVIEIAISADTKALTAVLEEHAARLMDQFADYAAKQAISGLDLHGAVIGFEDGAGI